MSADDRTKKHDRTLVIDDAMLLLMRKKRRNLLHQTCLLSVMAAFTIGLAMGIFFLPLIGLTSAKSPAPASDSLHYQKFTPKTHKYDFKSASRNRNQIHELKGNSFTPSTINSNFINPAPIYSSVSFVSDENDATAYNGKPRRVNNDYEVFASDGDDVAFAIAEGNNGLDDWPRDSALQQSYGAPIDVPADESSSFERENNATLRRIVDEDIFWGQMVESRLPSGFSRRDTEDWQEYLARNATEIIKIEQGCGRMQNRLVTFSDGVKACVRYRQNTDQIQGELFSFFLGRLLNITNLAPSTAAVINWDSRLWSQVKEHITESQWKTSRPVVLTKWIDELEPSGIPESFRPLERHLNVEDIRNITLDDGGGAKPTQILIDRLKPKHHSAESRQTLKRLWQKRKVVVSDRMSERFVELAQWSDLIVFDYLIANLDRVVNNLYNFQWNAEIMAAPAHNLAKQLDSQLLVFLDNESGLLHGYRLLKKYEAYHALLLDNLCVFRKSTIDALKLLRDSNPGEQLNEVFERTQSSQVREVLPPLPEKSIKILRDRIDRVLQQVQKCQELYSNR
jgi:four-jointed box protein 1